MSSGGGIGAAMDGTIGAAMDGTIGAATDGTIGAATDGTIGAATDGMVGVGMDEAIGGGGDRGSGGAVDGAESVTQCPPRFLVDDNAARLVRWLRLLGCDTTCLPGAPDAELVERACAEQRVLLTRDRGIMARRAVVSGAVRAILLASDDTWQQLEQVVGAYHLDPARAPFSRCAACNGLLESVPPQEARPHVPPFVAATHRAFTRCPGCGRFYWRGTHWQRVTSRLARLATSGER